MPPVLYPYAMCNLVIGSGALLDQVQPSRLGWIGVPFCLLPLLTLAFEPAQAQARSVVAS